MLLKIANLQLLFGRAYILSRAFCNIAKIVIFQQLFIKGGFVKKFNVHIILAVVVCMLMSVFSFAPVFAFQKGSTTSTAPLSSTSAYVIFSNTIQSRYMTFKDGIAEGVTDKSKELYSEKVDIDGVQARKIYSGNYLYLSLDKTRFSGKKMLIVITYYDYGPDAANFWLQYSSSDNSVSNPAYKELAIRKTGMEPRWKSVSFLVDDAAFKGSMNYGCDIRIRSGAYNAISKIEVMDYSAFTHAGTVVGKYTPSVVSDKTTGRTSYYMDFNGKPAIRPYVTAQSWNYDGTKFIFGSYNPVETTDSSGNTVVRADENGYRLYEYDIINNIIRQIDYNITSCVGGLNAVVSPDDYIYYSRSDDGTGNGGTYRMNWLTYEKERLISQTNSTMNVTNDGKYMSGYSGVRRSLTDGKATSVNLAHVYNLWNEITHVPEGEGHSLGHPMINPEYPHLLFFCHEGTTNYIHDRLWISNLDTGESYNSFVQAPYSTTETAETSGHEVWAMDGEMMYWVKYSSSNNAGQSGLMRMDKFGSNREYINGDYNYWHCSPSGDNIWIASDTNTGQIILVNANTYSSYYISKFNMFNWVHPNQPHPHISFNSHAVSWQMMNSNSSPTGIGWQIVRDITAHAANRQIVEFTNSANIVTCKGSANYTTAETISGTNYRVAAANCGVFVDIPNEVVKSTNANISVQISYLDRGTKPLKLVYTSGVNGINDLPTRENKTYSITKSGSNTNKTVTVNLNGINVNDAGRFRTDFYLASDDGAYISSVKVSTTDPTISGYEPITAYTDINSGNSSGLEATCYANTPSYDNTLYSIDDVEGWTAAGITQETVNNAKSAGSSYVTLNTDGAWMYASKADSIGNIRKAVFAPRNYRQTGSYYNISGNAYFKITDDTITENDNNLTIEVDYLDLASGFNIVYASTNAEKFTTVNVKGGGTGLWKKATINVTDAKMSSTNSKTLLGSTYDDIKIQSLGSEMYISKVSVSKTPSTANSGLSVDNLYYTSYGIAGSKTNRISSAAENGGEAYSGIRATSMESANYDNQLYHINDTAGWKAAGFTQDTIDAAVKAGCSYVTKNYDGAWNFGEYTDSNGITKSCFWSPRNYRPTSSSGVNSGMYFRVIDETITPDDNELVFVMEYLDTNTPIAVTYTSTDESGLTTFSIPAGNTYTWKTTVVTVSDAALSSSNKGTKLALGTDDIKINGRGADLYLSKITIMKKASNVNDAEIYGSITNGKNISAHSLASTTATVKSSMSTATTVVAYTAVYAADGALKQVEKSPYVNISAGKSAMITVPDVAVSDGETYRTFVWESNFAPIVCNVDLLKTNAEKANDGTITISWDETRWSGNFFHIYCDGELVGRTRTGSCKLYKIPSGSHEYIIDVVEPYGKTVYRQRGIAVPD